VPSINNPWLARCNPQSPCACLLTPTCHTSHIQDPINKIFGGEYASPFNMKLVKTDVTNEYEKDYPEVRVSE
jgi:hypothetical protein